MEVNDENLSALTQCLEQTLVPDRAAIRAAEENLAKLHPQPGYPLLLLTLLQQSTVSSHILQAAAVEFKNFVGRNWAVSPDEGGVAEQDRVQIKTHIVDLMLGSSNRSVSKQLSTALETISEHEFPQHWPELLPQMLEKLQTQDYNVINGVLRTIHAIIRSFRHAFSKDIDSVVVYVVKLLCEPLLVLFKATMERVKAAGENVTQLLPLLRAVQYCLKLFYSLNYVTLPELIENHLTEWFSEFGWLLQWQPTNTALSEHADSDVKPGPLPRAQALVCDATRLFIEKYEEEFEPFLGPFVDTTWQLLTRCSSEERDDTLVIAATSFLATVSTSIHHSLFNSDDTLKQVCENVVIPSITLRDSDAEMFEDNPQEYIKRDIEGSDSNTRRRAATELVKGLRKHYEETVSGIFTAYINLLLQQYAANPAENWRAKDAAMYLVTALSVTTATAKAGANRTNEFVNVVEFYAASVLPELASGAEAAQNGTAQTLGQLVLSADALRFSSVFRQTLPEEAYTALLPLFAQLLKSPCMVVHTYAAACTEHFLQLRNKVKGQKPTPRIPAALLTQLLPAYVENLFALLPGGSAGLRENVYIMRAVMRVITNAGDSILDVCGPLAQHLVAVLATVAAAPLDASFNHYLFESLAALIKRALTASPDSASSFEQLLFPVFEKILADDVVDFAPYVFQLLAVLLESTPNGVTDAYQALLTPLLSAVLWERQGNVPGLVRLLAAYARRGPDSVVANLQPTLGVFQQLLVKKATDHEAFYLLEALVQFLPETALQPHLITIFQLIFQRLQRSKTVKLMKSFTIFLGLFFGKHSNASQLAEQIDSIDKDIFGLVLEKIWLPNILKVSGAIERKIMAIGSIALLTKCELLVTKYQSFWPRVLERCVGLFELDEQPDDAEDDDAGDDEPQYSSGASFNALHHAARVENDPFAEIDVDLRALLVKQLATLSAAHPGAVQPLIGQAEAPVQTAVATYAQTAGVQL
mmetsp:Transcript_18950/g.32689  ORF Transcript_18950/g.32689 Transcript_18950/m.32689 type:complete len:984 (+) Transcript_18950:46-2997(+)